MRPEKKLVQGKATRKSANDKIKHAMNGKPTASSIVRQGLTPESLNKIISRMPEEKRRNVPQRIVRNARPSRTTRPTLAYRSPPPDNVTSEAIPFPIYSVMETPDWFNTDGDADVSIVVPLWKSWEVVKDQIRTWTEEDDGLKKEIIYVDDRCPQSSRNAVLEAWAARKPRGGVGKIIMMAENCGFGRACNVAACEATGEYLIFLNSDTTVTEGWVKPMIDMFEDEDVGIVGNMHMKDGGQWHGYIDSAGSEWNWQTLSFEHIARHIYRQRHIDAPFTPENAPADAVAMGEREMVTGCCFAIRRDVFAYLGGFDHNYRIGYWEDADLCMRVRELGYKIMFQPSSVIWHKLSASGSGGHPYMRSNVDYFHNKWTNTGRLDPLVWNPRPGGRPKVRSVFVKRFGANGDVFLATGVLPALKKKWPGCRITFCTACKEVVNGNPHVDAVVQSPAEVEMSDFQVVINLDLSYEYHPNWSITESYAHTAGVDEADCEPWIRAMPSGHSLPEDYAVVHARSNHGSGWVGKNWSQGDMNEVVHRMRKSGICVVSVGSTTDWDVGATVDLRGKTRVGELATIMRGAKLFLGADSFPMHVANHFGVPGVAFFGAVSPDRILKPGSTIRPVQAEGLACLGCHHRKRVPCIGTDSCENKEKLACESQVTADVFWDAVLDVIRKERIFWPALAQRQKSLPVL